MNIKLNPKFIIFIKYGPVICDGKVCSCEMKWKYNYHITDICFDIGLYLTHIKYWSALKAVTYLAFKIIMIID